MKWGRLSARISCGGSSFNPASKQGGVTIDTEEGPRTIALLTSFLYRAAGDLGAAAINARSELEAAHASEGRALCVEMFRRLTPSRTTDARVAVGRATSGSGSTA